MSTPWSKPISKVSVKTILSTDPMFVNKLTPKEASSLEKRLRGIVNRRINTIEKYNEFSHAREAIYGKGGRPIEPVNPTLNQLRHLISTSTDFLKARTSSLTGIRSYRKETSARVFGGKTVVNKKGKQVVKPNYVFKNAEEERRFWRAHDEFKHQYPAYGFQYAKIQQYLGEETFWKTRDFNAGDLNSLLVKMEKSEYGFDPRAEHTWDDIWEELP